MKTKWNDPFETVERDVPFGHTMTGYSKGGKRPDTLTIEINEIRGCGMTAEQLGKYMIHLLSRVK